MRFASRAVSALLLLQSLVSADEALVQTPLGPVQGLVLPDGSGRLFMGVPYAAPITRWRDSTPVAAWAPSTLDATVEAPGCIQLCTEDEPPHICPAHQSEQCLIVNIWTPRLPATGSPSWPVIVFMHGGNFHDGYAGGLDSDGGLLYDGRAMANATGSIIVVIQYRLGAFGFLYLGDAAASPVGGNFGLRDQELAFRWTRANIAAFGGDASRITAMGQSAGAMSISCHMGRGAAAAGLFDGGVMLSNPFGEAYRAPESALAIAGAFANFSGCGQALNWVDDPTTMEACLRGKDAATVLAAQMLAEDYILADLGTLLQIVVAWSPTIGTPYLPLRPLDAFQRGAALDVPYMVGTTANETIIFVYEALQTSPGAYIPLGELEYDLLVGALLGPANAAQIADYYPVPAPPPADFKVFASTPLTDGLFLCATRNATEALFAAQPARQSKAYHWLYSHILAGSAALWQGNFTECFTTVCHGSDLPELFHPRNAAITNYTAEEDALALTMQRYIAAFARTGDPGDGGIGLQWPAYDAVTRQTVNYETASMGGVTVISSYRAKTCAWWDSTVGYLVW